MKVTITEDDMTVHLHTEEIPPVSLVHFEGDDTAAECDVLAIGERAIQNGWGITLTATRRKDYEHQLLEAVAAIRWFDKEQHELEDQ